MNRSNGPIPCHAPLRLVPKVPLPAVAVLLFWPIPASAQTGFVRGDERSFVEVTGNRAVVHCGKLELHLDASRGFSMAAARKAAATAAMLLESTAVRVWLGGRPETALVHSQVSNMAIAEEGPQRIVLRAPFFLLNDAGAALARAQYDLACYPEGEVFVTLRVSPQTSQTLRVAADLRFAGADLLDFERPYDLPLVFGRQANGDAVGVYWHDGEPPQVGVIGDETRCLLPCEADDGWGDGALSRTFVISLSGSPEELRRRCLAHIDPLRPIFMESCRPLVEQTPESRGIASRRPRWCYSFRDGVYNVLADGHEARLEFYNDRNVGRRIRLRVVSRTSPALEVFAVEPPRKPDVQLVSLKPSAKPEETSRSVASLAAFDLAAHECPVFVARRSEGVLLRWVGATYANGSIVRLYRVWSGIPATMVAEIVVTHDGPAGGLAVSSIRSPKTPAGPSVAALEAAPVAGEVWGRFSIVKDVSILRNRPDRVGVHVELLNEAGNMRCFSQLVFRREDDLLALYGYHTLKADAGVRLLRTSPVLLPGFRMAGDPETGVGMPARFHFVDRRNRVRLGEWSGSGGFGYETGGLGAVNRKYTLCGFDDASSRGVVFLGRSLDSEGRLVADGSTPRVSMGFELPSVIARDQEFRSCWKMVVGDFGGDLPETLGASLKGLKGSPVDIGRGGATDGRVAHRVFELDSSANPLSPDANAYLIDGGRTLALVGAGADGVRWPWLFRVRAMGFDPERVRAVFLAHAGACHAGGARALKRLTGAPISAHATSIEALSIAGPEQDQRTGTPWNPEIASFESTGVDTPMRGGESIRVGALNVQYRHAPGPGGESGYYVAETGGLKVAFVGNLLPGGPDRNLAGEGVDAHRHGHLDDWIDSLEKLRGEHPDLVLGDHAPPRRGLHAITEACNRWIDHCKTVVRLGEVDYLLPRPMVVRRSEVNPGTIRGDELWGVKELPEPAVWRRRPPAIAPGVWLVGGGFAGEPGDANVYLVDGGGEMALIGAGSGLHTGRILERILSLGKDPLEVDWILLPSSHWHEARGAGALRTATQSRVCAHRYEVGVLAAGDTLRTGLRIGAFSFDAFPPCSVDRQLSWGETLEVGTRQILVLDAPGYHRGSTAFLMVIDGKRYLFSGQAAIGDLPTPNGGLVVGAIGWLDYHWGGSIPVWQETLRRLIFIRPDVLLPGQGRVRRYDADRQLYQCLARLDRLADLPAARSVLPPGVFEGDVEPRRPDISRLKP